jgi:hypothetical protein
MKDDRIDKTLIETTSSFCSTIKLYIIKQLCYTEKVTFDDLCSQYTNRNIVWIRLMTTQRISDARHTVILPTPSFECHNEFKDIYEKLTSNMTNGQRIELIKECSIRQDKAYCFLIRFIYFYIWFYMKDQQFVELIERDISTDLSYCFEPVGRNLIHSLCTSFDENSYFRLNLSMCEEDLHQRLLVLNIIALLISFKSTRTVSFLSFLLFDGNMKMPENYTEHFKNFDSLTGVGVANDLSLIQVINIRTQIHNLRNPKIDIARCSSDCYLLFYFIDSEILHEQKQMSPV